jgi:hypothetical protein
MILVDTSVWINHLRNNDPYLVRLLTENSVLSHPFVRGELALGNLRQREAILAALDNLPQAPIAFTDEVNVFHRTTCFIWFGHRIDRRAFVGFHTVIRQYPSVDTG